MKSRENTTQLQELVRKFVEDRKWESDHNPKNLSMSIAIESAELMEIFQWMSIEESMRITDTHVKEHIAEELADVLIYCFSLSNQFGFDVAEIVKEKMQKNAIKYPVK
ncbi:nucleotide pyrophosphohydrolase [Ureibacillus sp. FSL K6-2830]|jgi:NTP pyrophosphatase (non-canonical NTP hydrolase)|uniref:nucleotide pyrophosphohydrolase n=1 Tax=Ureibacillus sp. FSL K6-2830 TaxID=2954610 RepID=UPI0030F4B409